VLCLAIGLMLSLGCVQVRVQALDDLNDGGCVYESKVIHVVFNNCVVKQPLS
jgi:hypothetical protein